MKKSKLILASLCASAMLFSAAPSFAEKEEKKIEIVFPEIEQKEELTSEQKVERIINYLKNLDKVQAELKTLREEVEQYPKTLHLPPNITYDVPGVHYGVHYVTLFHEGDRLGLEVHQAGGKDVFSHTEFYLYDYGDNGYGSLDGVWDDSEIHYSFSKVKLSSEEKEAFDNLYKGIIGKFYSENESRIIELENIEKAIDILKSKENRRDLK